MKILFDHSFPFALAHGGFQVQIEETKAALQRRGIEVDYLRWWDDRQAADIIHYFQMPSPFYLELARTKGVRVVVTHIFTGACNRPPWQLKAQGLVTRSLLGMPGANLVKSHVNWHAFRQADRMIVGLQAESRVLQTVYRVTPATISVVPLGLAREFLDAGKPSRSAPHLISTGTITPRKRSVELARLAKEAQVPILFVGKPYSLGDGYWKEFASLIDGRFVLHHDHVTGRGQMIELLQASRGFVLFSQWENWCLSAHEAAACGLPLLVPDQPWSRECFGAQAHYLAPRLSSGNSGRLREFYDRCPALPSPNLKLHSWDDVAGELETVYRLILDRR